MGDDKIVFRAYWGKWYNFIPPKYQVWNLLRKSPYDHSREKSRYWYWDTRYRPWRGEGTPAPWIMLVKPGRFGISLALQRSRPWLHPEYDHRPSSEWMGFDEDGKAVPTGHIRPARSYLLWGIMSLVWKPLGEHQ